MRHDEAIRVVFLAGSVSTGGAERFVSNAVTRLDRGRFQPYLAVYRPEFSYPIPNDVPVKVLGKFRPWHNPVAALRFARWIDSVRPDVVLSAWSVPNVFAAETLRWTRHRPVWVARVANNPASEEAGLYGWWARNSYKRADAFVAVCRGLSDAFRQRYPFASDRITTIYNSVDPTSLVKSAWPPAVLTHRGAIQLIAVGRLQPQKRLDIALRAVALARERVNVHLNVLGDGEHASALRRLAGELGIINSVSWHGFRDNPYPFLSASDIFLLTSDYEGLSNALLEAQALGLPAVVTDCPFGSSEIVKHGETGLVNPIGQVAEIAQSICALAGNAAVARRMGRAATARVSELYSLDVATKELEDFLQGMVEAKSCVHRV